MPHLPGRTADRKPLRSSYWSPRWSEFIIPVVASGVILQLLFLGNMSYLYGVLFQSGARAHNLKVLAVDYDGGEIGEALSLAYKSFEADRFPTLEFASVSEYPTPESLQEAVCGGYWAAIYTHSEASDRLLKTIEGGNTTAYDPASTISYVYNGVYYPVISSSLIEANMQALITAASRIFYQVGVEARAAVNLSDPVSAGAFLNPIQPSSIVMTPMDQGSRVLFNTVSMVMPTLMQFFFSMAMNGVFTEAGVFSKASKRDVYLLRLLISKVYTFLGSLAMTGYIWAFREDWAVSSGQFVETWMCLWFYMEIGYVVVDTLLDVVIPIKFFSFFLLTWIIVNIASTVYPFELVPLFYRWGYALPAHNVWRLLMTIWSGGCRAQNEVALPVLFAWWLLGHGSSAWAVRQRCIVNERIDQKSFEMTSSTSIMENEADT